MTSSPITKQDVIMLLPAGATYEDIRWKQSLLCKNRLNRNRGMKPRVKTWTLDQLRMRSKIRARLKRLGKKGKP